MDELRKVEQTFVFVALPVDDAETDFDCIYVAKVCYSTAGAPAVPASKI